MQMLQKKNNLILDCDGVLYPLAALPTEKFVTAMKDVYRSELKLSGEEQSRISLKTIAENHLGMFNYILEMCYATGYDFNVFCRQMSERMDYSAIKPNPQLWKTLKNLQPNHNIAIWSNGCRPHLDCVFDRLFSKNTTDVEAEGILVFDICKMKENGYFKPKQSEGGFALFFKKTGFQAQDCILFDDTARNLTMAKAYGVRGVLVKDETPLQNLLMQNKLLKGISKSYE